MMSMDASLLKLLYAGYHHKKETALHYASNVDMMEKRLHPSDRSWPHDKKQVTHGTDDFYSQPFLFFCIVRLVMIRVQYEQGNEIYSSAV